MNDILNPYIFVKQPCDIDHVLRYGDPAEPMSTAAAPDAAAAAGCTWMLPGTA